MNDVREHDTYQMWYVQGVSQPIVLKYVKNYMKLHAFWPTRLTRHAAQCHTLPHIFWCIPMTEAYNHFINMKNIYKSSCSKIKSLNLAFKSNI